MKVRKKDVTAATQKRRTACPKCGREVTLRCLRWRRRCPQPRNQRTEVLYTPERAEAHVQALREQALATFAQRMGDPSLLQAKWLPSAVEREMTAAQNAD